MLHRCPPSTPRACGARAPLLQARALLSDPCGCAAGVVALLRAPSAEARWLAPTLYQRLHIHASRLPHPR
eukprot:5514446-Pleurochrysis_carterae.AAC.1